MMFAAGYLHAGAIGIEPLAVLPEPFRLLLIVLGACVTIVGVALVAAKLSSEAYIKKFTVGFGVLFGVIVLVISLPMALKSADGGNLAPEIYFDPFTKYYDLVFVPALLRPYKGEALVLAVEREGHDGIDIQRLNSWSDEAGTGHIGVTCGATDLKIGEKLTAHLFVVPPQSEIPKVSNIEDFKTKVAGANELVCRWQKVTIKEASAKSLLYIYKRLPRSERQAADSQIRLFEQQEKLSQRADTD